jgi:hypothetical protein
MAPRAHAAASYRRSLPRPKSRPRRASQDEAVNSGKSQVSKAARRLPAVLFALAFALPRSVALEIPATDGFAQAHAAAAAADCASPRQELRFEMLAANAEAAAPAGRGLQVCLAIYRPD